MSLRFTNFFCVVYSNEAWRTIQKFGVFILLLSVDSWDLCKEGKEFLYSFFTRIQIRGSEYFADSGPDPESLMAQWIRIISSKHCF